ncbi:MAG: Uma2 family endonuclease [Thermoflexales bacterium]|nr:Uma2 family endonuclease [Thermoflexales bacterium]
MSFEVTATPEAAERESAHAATPVKIGERPPWMSPALWAEYRRAMQALVTEDDQPVDNLFSAKQQALLVDALYTSWAHPTEGKRFLAVANVGVFSGLYDQPVVPDCLLSVGVEPVQELWIEEGRSYFTWVYNKPPDLVVEIVSNQKGGELERKAERYARIGVRYYVVYDPPRAVMTEPLRVMANVVGRWQEQASGWLAELGLGVTLWEGMYEGIRTTWLRWCDEAGQILLIGRELAELERQRAAAERQRAERLAAKLRELGIDPEQFS